MGVLTRMFALECFSARENRELGALPDQILELFINL